MDELRIPEGPRPQRRVGLVVPYDMALDAELWRWTPPNVALHFARTPYEPLGVDLEMVTRVGDPPMVAATARELAAISPEVCAYACTAGSFVGGSGGEAILSRELRAVAPWQVITTSGALVEACRALGARRLAVATPYDETITSRLVRFLADFELDVVSSAHLGLAEDIWSVPYSATAELVAAADSLDADAIVISCTNLPTYDLLAVLESRLGKPVISANEATMWAALGRMGLGAIGETRLLHVERR